MSNITSIVAVATADSTKGATKGGKDKKGGKGQTKGATPNEPEVGEITCVLSLFIVNIDCCVN